MCLLLPPSPPLALKFKGEMTVGEINNNKAKGL